MTSKTAYTRQNTYDEMHTSEKSSDKMFKGSYRVVTNLVFLSFSLA